MKMFRMLGFKTIDLTFDNKIFKMIFENIHYEGVIFWFTLNRLFGSYLFLTFTSLS